MIRKDPGFVLHTCAYSVIELSVNVVYWVLCCLGEYKSWYMLYRQLVVVRMFLPGMLISR